MLYYICKGMQTSESIVNTGFSIGCNVVLRYNNRYNKTSISMLFYALFCICKKYNVNKYSTLSANRMVG
ncbi:hypothetical protein SAMN05443549_1069 [Flavobacterium fluvii]|uniref:Uncharacterized protein n=1 Tax=Flavobacterium fluvii TaxID=468056 RepID=A0A1M5M2H8_9FLAO|nr:hypothetical protein SAMN05443549_1069 [Flavobacterium fluvii]